MKISYNRIGSERKALVKAIWYEGNGADYGRSHHYNDSRYHMLYVEQNVMCRKSSNLLCYQ